MHYVTGIFFLRLQLDVIVTYHPMGYQCWRSGITKSVAPRAIFKLFCHLFEYDLFHQTGQYEKFKI